MCQNPVAVVQDESAQIVLSLERLQESRNTAQLNRCKNDPQKVVATPDGCQMGQYGPVGGRNPERVTPERSSLVGGQVEGKIAPVFGCPGVGYLNDVAFLSLDREGGFVLFDVDQREYLRMRRQESRKGVQRLCPFVRNIEPAVGKLRSKVLHPQSNRTELAIDTCLQNIECGARALAQQFEGVSRGACQGHSEDAAHGQQDQQHDTPDKDGGETDTSPPNRAVGGILGGESWTWLQVKAVQHPRSLVGRIGGPGSEC